MRAITTQATMIPAAAPDERFEAAVTRSSRLASKNDVGDAVGAADGLTELMPVSADGVVGVVDDDVVVVSVCKSRRTIAGSTKQLAAGSMQLYPSFPPHAYSACVHVCIIHRI